MKKIEYRIKLFFGNSFLVVDNTMKGIQSIIKALVNDNFITIGNQVILTKHVTNFKLFKIKIVSDTEPPEEFKSILNDNAIEIPLTREEITKLFDESTFNSYEGEE